MPGPPRGVAAGAYHADVGNTGEGRTLVVVRHAKAEPYAASDFERALADRGRADAAAAGNWIAGTGVAPDLALVSAAVRTRQTWESMASAAGWDLEPQLDRSLYAADEDTVLELLAATPDEVTTVVVIGHNPTMAVVAQLLDDGAGDPEATAGLSSGYPTCAVAVFDLPGGWGGIGPGGARLRAFHVGRA